MTGIIPVTHKVTDTMEAAVFGEISQEPPVALTFARDIYV